MHDRLMLLERLNRLLSQAGLTYIRVERWAETAGATQFEEEPLRRGPSTRIHRHVG